MAPEIVAGFQGKIKGLAIRAGEKEPVEKMDGAVEVIAGAGIGEGSTGEGGPPFPVGHLGVGVVGADGVEAEEGEGEKVGGLRKDEPAARREEDAEAEGDDEVLHPPIGAVSRGDSEEDGEDEVNEPDPEKETAMAGWQGRGGFHSNGGGGPEAG